MIWRNFTILKMPFILATLMVLAFGPVAVAQSQTIKGTVSDNKGQPLPGVTVVLKGTGNGTVTNFDGNYLLKSKERFSAADTLVFSFVGFKQTMIPINNKENIDVSLQEDQEMLNEVVVVGYGSVKRRELTGAISSIDREDIVREPIYSFENVLQGRAAGVSVVANSYRPGDGAAIRIRGARSLVAGNDPLVVMDGIPIAGNLMDISPSDIESIEILKDASATAIYGSRGANGVILITTRRGTPGTTQIEFSSSVGLQRISNKVDLMDAERYIELQRDAARQQRSYTSDEDLFLDWELDAIQRGVNTDWQEEAFGTGYQQNHHLSVRGGTDDTRYSLSGTMTEHNAIVENNDYSRAVGRLNLDQDVTNYFRAGVSTQISYSREHRGGNFRNLMLRSPLDWPERGEDALRSEFAVGESFPMLDLNRDLYIDQRDRTRIISNVYAELDILNGLTYRFNFSPDLTYYERGNHSWQNSTASTANNRTSNILYENIVDFKRNFGTSHKLHSTALYSVQTNRQTGTSVAVRGLPFEEQRFHNLGTAEETLSRESILQEWALESYMLRLNYSYLNRYLFTLTGRVDGSSRLAEGNKYGLFPSMAVAWVISDEPFMQSDILNELKLRTSYGDVGNTGINPYQTQGRVSMVGYSFGDQSVFGFQNAELSNTELRWERTRQFDLGVDFGILDNRISGTIGIYQQNTIDLLMNRQLPPTSGFNSTLQNIGSTRNRGLEANLSAVIFESSKQGGFNWTTDFIFHKNKNEIVELFGGKEDDPGNGWFIGQPINVHYDWQFVGIWQESERELAAQYGHQPGDMKLRDLNNNGSIDADDRMILGAEMPSWTGSISNRMTFKNFDFSFMLYTSQGSTIWSEAGGTSLGGMVNLRRGYNLNSRNVHYWTPESPSNEFPQPRVRGHDYSTPMGYFDASFVRVRNITLGYSLPASQLEKYGISKARINVAVQNPLTFTSFPGLDPEGAQNHNMPNYQTFLVGIEMGL